MTTGPRESGAQAQGLAAQSVGRVRDVAGPTPRPVDQDSRGILDPWLLRQRVRLTRHPVGPALTGLVERFWAVEWDLPAGTEHAQQVLTHPGASLSVGRPDGRCPEAAAGALEARLNGVARTLTTRVLTGHGWAVAAMTTPGGLGAFIDAPARSVTDRVVGLGAATGLDEAALIRRLAAAPDGPARFAAMGTALEAVVAAADPQRVSRAREVAAVAKLLETDRSLRSLDDLARRTGIRPRTLQRMFADYAGVSPLWVLRRYRLLEAADLVRDGRRVSWAAVAAELGYADQAHLSRDFRSATGQTPGAYADAQEVAGRT